VNFLTNIFSEGYTFEHLVIYDFISSILIFFYLFSVGYNYKSINKNMTITFGIITYLLSFFIFETFALFVYQDLNLNIAFYTTNIFWFFYFLTFLRKKRLLFVNLLLYSLMFYFNNQFLDLMTVNANVTMDVASVFLPNTINIYEYSYKFSISNPTMLGYPQFMSYIDALLLKMSFGLEKYSFLISNSFLFFWLNLLLFSELKTSKKNKAFICLFFIVLILNSNWLQFLFTSSLMSERIAGYLLAGILVTLFKIKNPTLTESASIFFILSFVYITKQFFSIIVLILFVVFIFNKQYRKGSLFIFSSFLINEIAYLTYFSNLPREHHIRQIDIRDTILDLLLFRDLKLSNIFEIFKNLWIDKPMTYLIFISFLSYFIALFKNKSSFETNLYFFISILNLLFIFLLYISAWRQMELESPIRYIYSFLIFYLILILKNFDIRKNTY
tara:strand:+ start:44555 stop:45883 length:1329 start_codon:yes stop_codon:yes gene_type:complete